MDANTNLVKFENFPPSIVGYIPMQKTIEPQNDSSKKVASIEKTLDALFSIRLSLVTMKLKGMSFVGKTEFKKILDEQKAKDNEVSSAIDDLFKVDLTNKNSTLSLDEMIQKAEEGSSKGTQLTKVLPGFLTSNGSEQSAA